MPISCQSDDGLGSSKTLTTSVSDNPLQRLGRNYSYKQYIAIFLPQGETIVHVVA